jgi:phosphatidylglycerol:prolipoprotein diacylglycerol transferase
MIALPYISTPSITIELPLVGHHTITPFGALVVIGVLVGLRCCRRMVALRGLDPAQLEPLTLRVLVFGFAMAHWVSLVFYFPDQVLARPWILLLPTSGLSSVGGFIGGVIAFAWVCRRRGLQMRAWADVLAYGLLAGFTIGRVGCSVVHDHPGTTASPDAWLAVGPWPDGTWRYDLGLVEMSVLAIACAWVYTSFDPRRVAPGRFTAGLAIAYGCGRFALDFLRSEDLRYAGVTVAQMAALGFVIAGLALWRGSSE